MKETLSENKNVNLLWTGGWDSTFQLLQLLIIFRCRVTPFYLIDEVRRSTIMEIRAMRKIKDCLLKEYPHIKELLQPTRFFAVSDLLPDAEITEAYRSIFKVKTIGIQYDWLARFCKQNLITDIQICINDSAYHDDTRFDHSEMVSENTEDLQNVIRVDPKFKTSSEYVLFRYYSFPIIRLTKVQMLDIAKKHGWEIYMAMTWFCHSPTIRMKPCGTCTPCLQANQEGLGWRIPLISRMVCFCYSQFFLPLKSMTKFVLCHD
jgi:hypothetical protein